MAKQQFYTSICVDNLAQFFAFGFITPASVFPFNHHLPDEFSLHSQGIPLHLKPKGKLKIPRNGIEASKQEDKYLKSAVVVVSIEDSELLKIEASSWYYLNGILPTYSIIEIIFEDEDAHDHFKYLTSTTGSVSADLLKSIKINKKNKDFEKLFEVEQSEYFDSNSDEPEVENLQHHINFDREKLKIISGYGAALSLCYVMSKNGILAGKVFKELSNLTSTAADIEKPFVLKEFESYLLIKNDNSVEETTPNQIRNDFFEVLVNCEQEKVLDKLIPFFETDFGDEKISRMLQEIRQASINIQKGKTQETKSEQMKKFESIERVSQLTNQIVTMFSLLNETPKLFSQPISTVTEEGYINFAITYGLRDKFYNLPKEVRQVNGLEKFVIECMHRYFLSMTGKLVPGKLQFDAPPTLVDILADPDTPELKGLLAAKFQLIAKNNDPQITALGQRFIPENPGALIDTYQPDSSEFTQNMVMQKAFDDINFNAVLDLYKEEKELTKARNKFKRNLNKL